MCYRYLKREPSLVSNYRTVSLTSTLGKIMESMVRDNLLSFALLRSIINPNQHSFVPKRSSCTQLLEAHYDWCLGLDDNAIYNIITTDFRKAFDVVPHDLLLVKLSELGVCKQTLQWIIAFLSNRNYCVTVNGKHSRQASMTNSVIQESVLSLLLFTLYINDLPSTCEGCAIKLFAYDVKTYKRISLTDDRVSLQTPLNKICAWAARWCLGLSVKKCYYLQIGYSYFVLVYKLNG